MTDPQIADLGPAFRRSLQGYRACFLQDRTHRPFDAYGRGLLSDLPRQSVEPIALAAGTAVRTLQEFLVTADGDHDLARSLLQQHVAAFLQQAPADPLGTVGIIDETSCRKKGAKTPGVPRQDRGGVGTIDNGVVPVHSAAARGRFRALLDAELTGADAKRGRWYRLGRQTTAAQRWQARRATVWVRRRAYTLLVARCGATGEVKYFVSNAVAESVRRLLAVACRRATGEHALRLGKQEAGLMH